MLFIVFFFNSYFFSFFNINLFILIGGSFLYNIGVILPYIGTFFITLAWRMLGKQGIFMITIYDHRNKLLWWLRWLKKKNSPAMWDTQVQFLGWKDPLEKNMATYSSILAWRILRNRWACLLQEGGPLPEPESRLLSNTMKWIVQGDTFTNKARDFIGKGHPGREQ